MNVKPLRSPTGANRGTRRTLKTPENDALAFLQLHHREFEELFRQLEQADAPDRQAAILRTISDGLAIHMAIEERHLYAAARPKLADDISDGTMDDHRGIKRILADIVDVSVSDPDFEAKLKALRDEVERHVHAEERKLFPRLRRAFSASELGDLALRMREQQEAMEGTEPRLQVYADEDTVPLAAAPLH